MIRKFMESIEKHTDKQEISQRECKSDLKVSGGTGLEQPWNLFRMILLHSPYAAEKVHGLYW